MIMKLIVIFGNTVMGDFGVFVGELWGFERDVRDLGLSIVLLGNGVGFDSIFTDL